MKHLSALDALFLHLETPETPMHVGSLMVLCPSAKPRRGRAADGFQAIRAHLAGRLHLAPVFSRRLATMPLDVANPVWVRGGAVNLEAHLHRIRLPSPGTAAQLEAAVARLHEGTLDRALPLWQFTVIEGLAGGQVGLYAKIHHAALDGQGGIAVAQALLDTRPRPPARPGAAADPQPPIPPSTARLLSAALRNTVAQYGRIARALPEAVKAAGRAGAVALGGPKAPKSFAVGPYTPLNVAVSAKRLYTSLQVPLGEAKEIAKAFDVKLNDVVLATCAGALRLQFGGDREAMAKAMIGAVPASLRVPGDTAASNQVTMMFVNLATTVKDPVGRLSAIHKASTRAKMITGSAKGAIPTDLPSLGVPWLMAAVTPLYRKAVQSKRVPPVANVLISNVPGPQVPLYLGEMKVAAYYPVSAITHGLALNITIISYDGSLDYGLVACRKAMPGLKGFARHLRAAHDELLALARDR